MHVCGCWREGSVGRSSQSRPYVQKARDYAIFNKLMRISYIWNRKLRKHGTVKPCEAIEI